MRGLHSLINIYSTNTNNYYSTGKQQIKTYLPECLHLHKLEVELHASGKDASVGRWPKLFHKRNYFLSFLSPILTRCPFVSEITHWLVKTPSRSHIQKIKTRIYIKTQMKITLLFESLHRRDNCDQHCQCAVSDWLRLSTEEPIATTFSLNLC